MTLDERMRRRGWWKGRIGEYVTREAGAWCFVIPKVPYALTYIAGFGSGHRNATRNAGVPDLAQRAKAAARKLARKRGRLA